MRTDEYVELSYKYGLEQIKENGDSWKDFLRLDGRIYNFEFNNIVVIFNQNKGASLLADYNTWNSVGRFVNKGATAIKVYPSRVFTDRANIRHLFDISQTSGKEVANNWVFSDKLKEEYVSFYSLDNSDINDSLRSFTSIIIDDVIEDRFGDTFKEYPDSTKNFIADSIRYLVFNRIRVLNDGDYDFSLVSKLNSINITQYGTIINNVSQEVLHDIFDDIRIINENIKKERDNYGQGLIYGIQVQRGRTRLFDSGISRRDGINELRDQQVGDSLGGLDGRYISSGVRRTDDVSGVKVESNNAGSIDQSERRNNAPERTDEKEEWNGQNSRLSETPSADKLREFSSGGDYKERNNRSEEDASILARAKQLINEYSYKEFGELADFSNLINVNLAYTTITDEESGIEYDYEIAVDLVNYSIDSFVNGDEMYSVKYENLDELVNEELTLLDFDQLVSVPDEVWDRIREIEIDNEAERALNDYDKEFGADGSRVFPHLNDEHEVVKKTTSFSRDLTFVDIKELEKGEQLVSKTGNIHTVKDDLVPLNHFRQSVVRANGQNESLSNNFSEFYDDDDYIEYTDIREIRFADGGVYHLTDEEIAELEGMDKVTEFSAKSRKQYDDNIDGYSFSEIHIKVGNYIKDVLSEYAPDLEIIEIELNGSRIGGYYTEHSDLDVVLFVKAPTDNYIREDFLFDLLHGVRGNFEGEDEEQFTINGITVDINPKLIHNYAEIGGYLNSAEKYMEEAAKRKTTDEAENLTNEGNIISEKAVSEEIAEVIDKTDIDEIADTLEPSANETYKQASLFDADFWMGYVTGGENITPVVDFSSNILSEDGINEILKTDGRNRGGRLNIYEKYRENLTPEEMADFLRKEYGNIAKGFTINGIQIAMVSDENGITFGNGISARDNYLKRLSWEEVEKRTRNLVETGSFLNVSEIELVDEHTRNKFAEYIEYVFRDLEEPYPPAVLPDHQPGFPDNTKKIAENLKSKNYIRTILKELNKIKYGEYTPRFKGISNHHLAFLLPNLSFYLRDKVEYLTRNDVILIDETFVSQETLDIGLKGRGSGFAGGKLRIEEWFRENHSTKETVDFLKKEYGIGGGTHWAGDGVYDDHDSRGITVTIGQLLGENIKVKYGYNEVAKRLKYLVSKGEYLSESQKKEYDNKMAARAAFLDGLEEGNIYRLNDSSSILEGEFKWITEIDWDSQTFKAIGIYLNDDFTFNIEDNEHTYRHLYSYDFKHFPDYNYEFVKNARDLGGLDLVHFVSETYPSDNDWIVKLSDGIKKDVVDNDILDNIVDEVNIVKESTDDITDDVIVEDAERINYRIDLNDLPESVGPKARFRRNIDAIKTLKIIEGENRLATAEEQKIMSLYVGWGGLSEAFDENNTNWASEYLELKKLLNDTEYSSARASVNTAFYTDPRVINAVSEAVKNMGFKGGNILEPSCAIGNFFGTLDENILNNSNVYGVEIDDVSGRIARQLYQKVDISICGFEDTDFSDNFFDLAIGNVPFGQYKVYDKDYRDLNFNIHDYFFAKTLDKVRPGGIVAFITTIGTLDKKSDVVRKYIGERAELLGAIRLPDITFKDFAGTKASSDIIFLKKREHRTIEEPEWLDILPNSDDILVNRYFIDNPDMMLGKMVTDNRFGDRKFTSCTFNGDTNQLYNRLNDTITNLPSDIYTEYEVVSEDNILEDTIPADPKVRNYTYTVIDDEIYFRTNSIMTKRDYNGKDKDRVKACISISDYVRKVMNMQLNGCGDEELSVALEGLNEVYDKFVKEYGYFHDRKNHSLFQDDDSYNILEALEMEDEDSKTYLKSPFFSERTIKNAETVQSVDNAVDALNCSINDYGRVELPYMASIYDKPIEQIRKEMLDSGVPSTDLEYETDEEIKMHYLINELKGIIFMNPMAYDEDNIFIGWETADEYLSGNVRRKLQIAKESAEQNPELFNINVSSLEEVIPEWIDATNIEVRLGTTWIDTSDYESFIYDKFEIPYRMQRIEEGSYWNNNNNKVIIEKDDINGSYYISNKNSVWSEKIRTTYGTDRLNALEIFERLLNLKIVTVYDTYEENGKKKRVVNNKETMLARDKAETIKQEFRDWIFSEPDRREKYEKYYNENFNNTHLRAYNGDYLTFPGMTPTIQLRPHQKNAVSHILLGGNTLLAHAVGAGKSFEMFAAVMEQRRLGLANKPVIVVPKSIINQTANEFMRLYPTANLLVANTKNFAKKDRMRFLSRASTGDYDCIIMSHEQFKEIPISKERMITLLNREYDTCSQMLEDLAEKDRQSGGKKWTIKRMEKEKQNIENKIKKIEDEIAEGKIDLFTFEETGIDSIFVDEAHNYKNRGIFTKMSNISGVSTTDSKQAMDMYFKTQYLNEKHSGRGVVFATGTPISNSMCEMYVMQTYLQNDRLIDRGVAAFDNWATSFGEVTQSLDLSVEGNGYRLRNKFNKFVNVPELLTMFHEFADVQTAEMLQLPDVPKMRGGKAIIVESQVDDFTKMYMDSIVERAEALRNKQVSDPRIDNFLKITSEARLLGTDARLLDGSAPDNPDGKLNKAADNIYKEYKDAEEKGIIGTQLVFSDIGTPSPNKFNVYDELKNKLIDKGISEEEIAFIHDAKTDVQRQKLFDNTQSGKIKVLFGSTSKLGTGVNVQHHLVALHHLDCPWRPSDIEQREGRGLRQGNVNDEVAIYRYVTVGTFDAYLWSVVENKQKFINQVMKGSITDRNMADIDETELGFAEIKAVASGNPKIKRKMELDMELNKLIMLKNSFTKNKYSLQDKYMKEYPREITRFKEQIEHLKADIVTRDKELEKNPDFEITICGTGETFNERKPAGQKILELARTVKTGGEKRFIAKYKGFEIYAEAYTLGTGLNRHLVVKGESTAVTDNFSSDYVGIISQIENKVKGLEKRLENAENNLELAIKNKKQAEIEFNKPFEHEEHLAAVKKELTEINTELDLDNVQDDQTFALDENGGSLDNDEPDKKKSR